MKASADDFLGVYKGTGEVGPPRMVDTARRRPDKKQAA